MGVRAGRSDAAADFVRTYRAPEYLAALCGEQGPRHLDADFELVQDTFRRFAEDQIRPVAEDVHRRNLDIPEAHHRGAGRDRHLRRVGAEGVRRLRRGGEGEYLAMVVATEELSRVRSASPGA